MVIRKSSEDAARYWSDSAIFGSKRSPENRSDFGDNKTIGLSLRRIGFNIDNKEFDPDDSFGLFLGQHTDGWIVAIKKFDFSGFSSCEVHQSLESIQRKWELD